MDTRYQRMMPNDRGHYEIAPMQVELGVWQGPFLNQLEQAWLRWWDATGNLLLTGREQADQEGAKRQQLVEKLKSLSEEQLADLGIDPQMLE